MPNPFAHVELSTDEVKKAKKFYAAVFAWKLNDLPAMNYTMIDVAGGVGGGIQAKQMPEQPTAWLPYVQVDDVKVTMAKVVKAGGTAMLEYQDIGEMGSIGIFADPQGAALGVWAPKPGTPPHSASPEKKAAKKASEQNAGPPAQNADASAKKAPPPPKKGAERANKAAPPAKQAAAPAKKAAARKAAAPPAPAKKAAAKPAAKALPLARARQAPAKKR